MTALLPDDRVVLLVDDVPDNLRMLSDALDDAGYVVLVATDGSSALERLDFLTPDIILLDAVMPGMDGFATCVKIKAHPTAHAVPVIFMTGLTEPADVVRSFDVGGIDFVTKPVQPMAVLARIEARLRSSRVISAAGATIDSIANAVAVLDGQGRLLWSTQKAKAWLELYALIGTDPQRAFSPELEEWIRQNVEARRGRAVSSPSPRFSVKTADGELIVHFGLGEKSREFLLRIEQGTAARAEGSVRSRDIHQLTVRELQVLSWLAKGKTNRDIADILHLSPRTVNKHLEHIFAKLGVENRSAAVAVALQHPELEEPMRLAAADTS